MKKIVFILGFIVVIVAVGIALVFTWKSSDWRFSSIPPLPGKVVICTGANAGIGFHFARHIAKNGATTILACRSTTKCNEAKDKIKSEFPDSIVEAFVVDLASLESIKQFVHNFKQKYQRLDVLCNNAGVMNLPYNLTVDGFEQHIGINHLGQYALTALLYPVLSSTPSSRVVSVSSMMEKLSYIRSVDPDNLNWENKYFIPEIAYSVSKQANVLFATELDRRLRGRGDKVVSVAAHPGFSFTELQMKVGSDMQRRFFEFTVPRLAQSAEMGAAPLLYAATHPSVEGGRYYGPDKLSHGWPIENQPGTWSTDPQLAARLWEVSEKLTRIPFLSER